MVFVDEPFDDEDTDGKPRAQIAGMRAVILPEASPFTGHQLCRRGGKWSCSSEPYRPPCWRATRPTPLALAPLLLASEAGLLVVAALGGWLGHKLRAYASLVKLRRQLCERRSLVQAMRRRSDAELFDFFSDRLDSPLLPGPGVALANLFCVPYMQVVRRLAR